MSILKKISDLALGSSGFVPPNPTPHLLPPMLDAAYQSAQHGLPGVNTTRPQLPIQNLQNLLGGVGNVIQKSNAYRALTGSFDPVNPPVKTSPGRNPFETDRIPQHAPFQFYQGQDFTPYADQIPGTTRWNPSMGGAPMTHPQEDDGLAWGPYGPAPMNTFQPGTPNLPIYLKRR